MEGSAASGTTDRLVSHLLAGTDAGSLEAELRGWIGSSPRFRDFAATYETKIRKKLRGAADPDARRDVRAELRAARLLLADRRFELEFEAYGSGNRGPDFGVRYRGERPFNVEVTRLRREPDEAAYAGVLLSKLHQLPPSAPNVLVVAIDGPATDADAIARAALALRGRADRKDETFFASRDFGSTRQFYDRLLRLGAVVAWAEGADSERRAAAWVNRSARIAVSERALRACLACLRAE